METERINADESWDPGFSDDEENEHQYDDYDDLFSNETASTAEDHDVKDDVDSDFHKQVSQLIMLRRHLDSLTEKLSEKKFAVLKSREELIACCTRMKALKEELTENEYAIVSAQEAENTASLHRLISKHRKLKLEIENEKKMELEISKCMNVAELKLADVEIEQKHYANLAEQVIEKEEAVAKHKQKMAMYRIKKEKEAELMLNKKFHVAEETLAKKFEDKTKLVEKITEDAIYNHSKAVEFLKSSLYRLRNADESDEEFKKTGVGKKIEAILSLKNNIAQNRENLKALQARDAAFKKKKEIDEKLERKQVLNEGGNPEQVLLRRKKFAQIEQDKQEFAEKQRDNKAKIVSNILKEEEYLKKRKKQQPQLWDDKERDKQMQVSPMAKTPVQNKITLDDDYKPVFLEQAKYLKKSEEEEERREITSEASSLVEELSKDNKPGKVQLQLSKTKKEKQEEILTQPEFQGLWDQKDQVHKVPKEEVVVRPVGGTKMEQEILERTMRKHRDGITVKQVAAGKEFKGKPFYSNPDVIHFKDLDVGKSYKKKVVITNVSYSINFLKLVGLSEHLKDFVHIDFNPPGQMSAGMSCEMMVTFKPMINEDLIGEVLFMAQTGPFSIDLKCTTKQCDLSVDVDSIDFGAQVVGETIRRSITLVNKGGLGTRFEFMKIPDKPATLYTLETSLGRLTTADSAGVTLVDVSEPLKTATSTQPETAKKSKRPMRSVPQTADNMSSIKEHDSALAGEEGFQRVEYEEEDYSRAEGDMFATPASGFNDNMPEELKVGEVMNEEIDAFSSVRLDIVFSPCIPGDIQANFRISFTDAQSQPIEIKITAVAIDVPVWIDRQNIDMKICMYDRLYQEQIQVHNRASTALRLNFEVPKELRGHIELLPKTGYIQAKSKFTAQLKFLPRQSLAEDAAGLFDPETGILETPMVVRVAEQTRPVPFVVNAVVTSSDLEFDQTEVDFGFCSIHESVVQTVKLTNHSILPQMYGFVGIPDFVDIQPNKGFGWILPLETIAIDLIMNANRARLYDFTLVCRTGINRNFTINCKATGVHPPLELSHQVVHFSATPLDDVSTAILYVVNSHTSANEFTHPVPRVGKGEIAPVGPTSFEFVVPDDVPINITPAVGIVKPGQKCHVTFEFSPKLNDDDVRIEACNVFEQQRKEREKEQERLKREAEEAEQKLQEEEKAVKHQKGKKTPKTPAKPKTGESVPKSRKPSARGSGKQTEVEKPTPDTIDENSTEYKAASAYLTRNYKGSFQSYTIPCFVASGVCSENLDPSLLSYDEVNTLYVEVHCPVIKPPVVIISNHGHCLTDFGQVSLGQNAIQPISIQNISGESIDLMVSILDTNGPFQMLNALRTLKADETHTVLVSFTPTIGKVFQEVLKINGPSSSLSIFLTGRGVTPVIKLTPEDGKLDFGSILQHESATASFTLENKSSLAVKYSMQLDSNSLLKHAKLQQLPAFITGDDQLRHTLIGPQNLDGSCVFDCVPCEGEIKTDEKHEVHVTFRPDHESRHFSDGARVILFNTEAAHVIHFTGKAMEHSMFVEGNDPLDVSVESLAIDGRSHHFDGPHTKNIVVSLVSKATEEGFASVTKELSIGCVKSNAPAAKKSGEWTVENLHAAHAKGFTIEPLKATVEADCTKPLTITWTPTQDHDPSKPCTTSMHLTLRADVQIVYNVLLNGLVSFS